MNRSKLVFTLLAMVAVALAASKPKAANAELILGPIYDPYSNVDLYVVPVGTWTQAESEAQAIGGNLVTIQSSAENQFIVDNVLLNLSGSGGPNLSQLPLWIGLYDPIGVANNDGPGGPDSQHAADFVWVDGSTSTYRDWVGAEPNNGYTPGVGYYDGGEYYTAMNWYASAQGTPADGDWNDTPVGGTDLADSGNSNGPYYGIAAVPTPEPSSLVLGLLGLAGLFVSLRRRMRNQAA